MKRYIWITAFIAISASLITAILRVRSAQHARLMFAELTNESKRLDNEIAVTGKRLSSSTNNIEKLQAALQQAQDRSEKLSSAPAVKPNATAKPNTPPSKKNLSDLMEANPGLRIMFKQSFRANLGLRFRPLYDAAQLSPNQIEKFEVLMTESEQDNLDLQATVKTQGLPDNDPAIAKMRQLSRDKLQNAQKEILGEAGYQSLQQYNRQQPLIGLVHSVAGLVAHTETPITILQAEQLLDVLSRANSKYESGGQLDPKATDLPLALQQAGQILSPIQLASLQANLNGIELTKLREQFYQQQKTAAK